MLPEGVVLLPPYPAAPHRANHADKSAENTHTHTHTHTHLTPYIYTNQKQASTRGGREGQRKALESCVTATFSETKTLMLGALGFK